MEGHMVTRCLLLALVTKCIQGACPEGCTCDDVASGLTVNCNGLKQLPTEFPEMTTKITICNLQAEEIPAKAFCLLPKLQTLEIFASHVERIQQFAFSGLKDLSKLGIYFSQVSSIEGLAFSHLQNIAHIEIHNTTIKVIRGEAFSDISNVMDFSFNNLTVTEIQAMAFTRVRRVATFSLRNSHFRTIETGAFHVSSFAFLFVHSNTFDNIMCGTFGVAIGQAMNRVSFGGNTMCCSCNMLWMFQDDRKRILLHFLEGLECTNPNAREMNRTLASFSWSDFPCDDLKARRRIQAARYCPAIVRVEEANTGALTSGKAVFWNTNLWFCLHTLPLFVTYFVNIMW